MLSCNYANPIANLQNKIVMGKQIDITATNASCDCAVFLA